MGGRRGDDGGMSGAQSPRDGGTAGVLAHHSADGKNVEVDRGRGRSRRGRGVKADHVKGGDKVGDGSGRGVVQHGRRVGREGGGGEEYARGAAERVRDGGAA